MKTTWMDQLRETFREAVKRNILIYIIMRALIIVCMFRQLFHGYYHHVLLCMLSLLLISIPAILKKTLRVSLPSVFEIAMQYFLVGLDAPYDQWIFSCLSGIWNYRLTEHTFQTCQYDTEGNALATIEGGYLHIGIIDTMKDLLVNFVGAVVFSICGFLYVYRRDTYQFAGNFIIRKVSTRKHTSLRE